MVKSANLVKIVIVAAMTQHGGSQIIIYHVELSNAGLQVHFAIEKILVTTNVVTHSGVHSA